jgi:hypothetical protein
MSYGDATPTTPVTHYLSLKGYADATGKHPRTVKRWLADGELPGARQDPIDGHWMIPADAVRSPKTLATASNVMTLPPAQYTAPVRDIPAAVPSTPQGHTSAFPSWDVLPTTLTVEQAAALMGVTEHAIASNQDYYGVIKHGKKGAMLVPLATVKRLRGL